MLQTLAATPGKRVETADQRMVIYSVPWSHFEVQLPLRGDAPAPRMSYLDGILELVRPSKDHERIRSYLGSLIVTYALERDIDLSPYGSWTLKHAPAAAGLEPDECFIVGSDQGKPVPDLAIEVVWTRNGIDKLEIYRRLGVGEVWTWRDDRIEVHVLKGGRFEKANRSLLFPDLDLDLLVFLLERPTVIKAIRTLREALGN